MLSIITPVYNGERFIESCIQGVINQNCPDMEHIIVDGKSTDNTIEIVQRYAHKYPHIRWISESDKGQSDAINHGILMARGSILGVLNVDDFYQVNLLNRIIQVFRDLPNPSFVIGNCKIWDDDENLLYINKPAHASFVSIFIDISQFPCNPSAYFYHSSLHKIVGMYDIEDQYTMDLDFVLRAFRVSNIEYTNEVFGNFRFIRGTKTFAAKMADKNDYHVQQVLAKYRQKLSWVDNLYITAARMIKDFKYFALKLLKN